MQWLTGDSSSWMHQQLPTSQCSEASPEGQRASVALCTCVPGYASRPCYAWMTLSQEQSCWRSMALNIKKEPGGGLLLGVHISAQGSPLMFECAQNLWKLGMLTEKNRCQWITNWLALCKPRYILKISGKNGRRDNNSNITTLVSGRLLTFLWHAHKILWLMLSTLNYFPKYKEMQRGLQELSKISTENNHALRLRCLWAASFSRAVRPRVE